MSISDQLGNLEECAKSSLTKLSELGLPVTARNYSVWYAYFADRVPGLKCELDHLAGDGKPLSSEALDSLYAKYIERSDTGSAASGALTDVEDAVARLSEFIANLGADSGSKDKQPQDNVKKATETSDPIDQSTERQLRAAASPSRPATRPERKSPAKPFGGIAELATWKTFHDDLRLRAIEVAESGDPVALLMIDLDRFGDFNERHGSDIGDKALELVARLLSEYAAPGGVAARYSATEFALVIMGASLDDATKTAEEIRVRYSGDDLFADLGSGGDGPVTLSIGVSEYDTDEPLAHFIQRARHALGCAKAEGRDRVVAKSDEQDAELQELRAS